MPSLTRRETDVLKLVAQGCTDPQVAQQLGLSRYTVKQHLRNIYRKLKLPNRTAVAAYYIRHVEARDGDAI